MGDDLAPFELADADRFLAEQSARFDALTKNDRACERSETAESIVSVLEVYRKAAEVLRSLSRRATDKHFRLFYNFSHAVYAACEPLALGCFPSLTLPYLQMALQLLETQHDSVLWALKYADWKLKIIATTANVYSSLRQWTEGHLFIEKCLSAFRQCTALCAGPSLEEKAAVEGIDMALVALRLRFKARLEKASLGEVEAELTRIPLRYKALMCVEVLRGDQLSFRPQLIGFLADLYAKNVQTLLAGLEAMRNFSLAQQSLKSAEGDAAKLKALESVEEARRRLVKEDTLRELSLSFPFEGHMAVVEETQVSGLQQPFEVLADLVDRRCELAGFECPFLTAVKFVVSEEQSVIEPGFDIKGVDLNEPYLKFELRRVAQLLLNSGRTAAKILPELNVELMTGSGTRYTRWQHQQTDHRFLYLATTSTNTPAQVVADIKVVIADAKKGPEAEGEWAVLPIPIRQYTGVKASTGKAPFLLLRLASIEGHQATTRYITDITVRVESRFHIRPSFGYQLLPVELRQVPLELIKARHNDYVYMECRSVSASPFVAKHMLLLRIIQLLKSRGLLGIAPPDPQTFDGELTSKVADVLESVCGDKTFFKEYFDKLINLAHGLWTSALRPLVAATEAQQFSFEYDLRYSTDPCISPDLERLLTALLFVVRTGEAKGDVLLAIKLTLHLCAALERRGSYVESVAHLEDTLRLCDDLFEREGSERLRGKDELCMLLTRTCSQITAMGDLKKLQLKFADRLANLSSPPAAFPTDEDIVITHRKIGDIYLEVAGAYFQLHLVFAQHFVSSRFEGPPLPLGVSAAHDQKRQVREDGASSDMPIVLTPVEQELIDRAGENPYLLALYYSVIARNEEDPDKRLQCLGEAIKAITKAKELEAMELEAEVPIMAFHKRCQLTCKDPFGAPPFSLLKDLSFLPKSPVVVHTAHHSLVFFIPFLSGDEGVLRVLGRQGKIDRGYRVSSLTFIRVDDLKPNCTYAFWAETGNGKNKTASGEWMLCRPLPLSLLGFILGTTAFLLRADSMAKRQLREAIQPFMRETLLPEPHLRYQPNPLFRWSFCLEHLSTCSSIEAAGVSQALLVHSYIRARELAVKRRDRHNSVWDFDLLKVMNFALLALEVAAVGENIYVAEDALHKFIALSRDFFNQKGPPGFFLRAVTRALLALSCVSHRFLSDKASKAKSFLLFHCLRLCVLQKEITLAQRLTVIQLDTTPASRLAALFLLSRLPLQNFFDVITAHHRSSLPENITNLKAVHAALKDPARSAEKGIGEGEGWQLNLMLAKLLSAPGVTLPDFALCEQRMTALMSKWDMLFKALEVRCAMIEQDIEIPKALPSLTEGEEPQTNIQYCSSTQLSHLFWMLTRGEGLTPLLSEEQRDEGVQMAQYYFNKCALLMKSKFVPNSPPGTKPFSVTSPEELLLLRFTQRQVAGHVKIPTALTSFVLEKVEHTEEQINHVKIVITTLVRGLALSLCSQAKGLSENFLSLSLTFLRQSRLSCLTSTSLVPILGLLGELTIEVLRQYSLESIRTGGERQGGEVYSSRFITPAALLSAVVAPLYTGKKWPNFFHSVVRAFLEADENALAARFLPFLADDLDDRLTELREKRAQLVQEQQTVGFARSKVRKLRPKESDATLIQRITALDEQIGILSEGREEVTSGLTKAMASIPNVQATYLHLRAFARAALPRLPFASLRSCLASLCAQRRVLIAGLEEYHHKQGEVGHVSMVLFFAQLLLLLAEPAEPRPFREVKPLLQEAVGISLKKFQALKGRFAETVTELRQEISQPHEAGKYNAACLHHTVLSLHTLAQFIYAAKPIKQKKCVDLALLVVELLLTRSTPHPQCAEGFASYLLTDCQYIGLFYAEEGISPRALATALEDLCLLSRFFDSHRAALPALAYLDFIATRLLADSNFRHRTLSLRMRFSARTGLPSASFMLDATLDIPTPPETILFTADGTALVNGSDSLLAPEPSLRLDVSVYDERNEAALKRFLEKKLDAESYIPHNSYFYFERILARADTLLALYKRENFVKTEFVQIREERLEALCVLLAKTVDQSQKLYLALTLSVLSEFSALFTREEFGRFHALVLKPNGFITRDADFYLRLRKDVQAWDQLRYMLLRLQMDLRFVLYEAFTFRGLHTQALSTGLAMLETLSCGKSSTPNARLTGDASLDAKIASFMLTAPFHEEMRRGREPSELQLQIRRMRAALASTLLSLDRGPMIAELLSAAQSQEKKVDSVFLLPYLHTSAQYHFHCKLFTQAHSFLREAADHIDKHGIISLSSAKIQCDLAEVHIIKGQRGEALKQLQEVRVKFSLLSVLPEFLKHTASMECKFSQNLKKFKRFLGVEESLLIAKKDRESLFVFKELREKENLISSIIEGGSKQYAQRAEGHHPGIFNSQRVDPRLPQSMDFTHDSEKFEEMFFWPVYDETQYLWMRVNLHLCSLGIHRLKSSRGESLQMRLPEILNLLLYLEENHILFRKNYFVLDIVKANTFLMAGHLIVYFVHSLVNYPPNQEQVPQAWAKEAINLLLEAKDHLITSINFLKQEPLFSSLDFSSEAVTLEIAHADLLLADISFQYQPSHPTSLPPPVLEDQTHLQNSERVATGADLLQGKESISLQKFCFSEACEYMRKSCKLKQSRLNYNEGLQLLRSRPALDKRLLSETFVTTWQFRGP